VNIELLYTSQQAPPIPLGGYADQLEELMSDLFSESASLYAEHGVALGESI